MYRKHACIYATVVHHRTGQQFRHPQWQLQAKWWGCCICSRKSQELQCSSRKLLFVRLRVKIEAMRQKSDKKCRGQPQSVPVFLFLHLFSLSGSLFLTVTVFSVAMVTSVAEYSKDAVLVMKISREEQHYLLILGCVSRSTHILDLKKLRARDRLINALFSILAFHLIKFIKQNSKRSCWFLKLKWPNKVSNKGWMQRYCWAEDVQILTEQHRRRLVQVTQTSAGCWLLK